MSDITPSNSTDRGDAGDEERFTLHGPDGQTIERPRTYWPDRLDEVAHVGPGWTMRVQERSPGAVVGCPGCGAQFGGVSTCPWEDLPLVPLQGVGDQSDDDVASAAYKILDVGETTHAKTIPPAEFLAFLDLPDDARLVFTDFAGRPDGQDSSR